MKKGRTARRTGRKTAESAKRSMLESLVHVWLAGLGAASKAQAKGPKWLRDLIKEGARLEAFERAVAKKAVRGTLGSVQALARRAVDELPPVRVLKEVKELRKQISALDAKLDRVLRGHRAPGKTRRSNAS